MQVHPYGALPRRQRRHGRKVSPVAFALTLLIALAALVVGWGASGSPYV
jgi:hypothetical protein